MITLTLFFRLRLIGTEWILRLSLTLFFNRAAERLDIASEQMISLVI